MTPISPTPDGIAIRVHVQPRASRTEVAGLHGDAIKVRLAAPPVDGAANDSLVRLLAEVFGVAPSAVAVTTGHTARRKVVAVRGVTCSVARQALGLSS